MATKTVIIMFDSPWTRCTFLTAMLITFSYLQLRQPCVTEAAQSPSQLLEHVAFKMRPALSLTSTLGGVNLSLPSKLSVSNLPHSYTNVHDQFTAKT
jgi:hypothetical protein